MLQSRSSHVSHFADELQSAHSHSDQYYLLLQCLLLLRCCSLGNFPGHMDFGSAVFCGRGRHTDETVKMQRQTPTSQAAGFPGMAVTVLLGLHESDVAGTAVQ